MKKLAPITIAKKNLAAQAAEITELQRQQAAADTVIDSLNLQLAMKREAILKKDDDIRKLLDRVAFLESDRGNLTSAIRILVREDDVDSGRAKTIELPVRPYPPKPDNGFALKGTPPAPSAEEYKGLAAWLPKQPEQPAAAAVPK